MIVSWATGPRRAYFLYLQRLQQPTAAYTSPAAAALSTLYTPYLKMYVRAYVSTPNFKFPLQKLNFAHFISLLPAKVDSMRGGRSQGGSI